MAPKTPNQVPPNLKEEVGKHPESDFNELEYGDDEPDDSDDSDDSDD